MAWPTDNLATTHFDQSTDSPASARSVLEDTIEAVKEMIAARASTDGVASLDANMRVPASQLPRGIAGGVASLDASTLVPSDQLPAAETGAKGAVEKSTSAENTGGTEADKFPDVLGVKEMIDEHGSGRTELRSTDSNDWSNGHAIVSIDVPTIDDYDYITFLLLAGPGTNARKYVNEFTVPTEELSEDDTPETSDDVAYVLHLGTVTRVNLAIGRNGAGTTLYFDPSANITGRVAAIWGGSF